MFISIRPLINRFVQRAPITVKFQEQRIQNDWQTIIGRIHKSARDKSQALYLKDDGELVVKVVNHLWLQELSFYREQLLREIKKEYRTITKLRLIT